MNIRATLTVRQADAIVRSLRRSMMNLEIATALERAIEGSDATGSAALDPSPRVERLYDGKLAAGLAAEIDDFLLRIRARLVDGAAEYGDRSFDNPAPTTLGEIAEEAADMVGWTFVLWERARRLRDHAARVEGSA